jgi:hypothetical protein
MDLCAPSRGEREEEQDEEGTKQADDEEMKRKEEEEQGRTRMEDEEREARRTIYAQSIDKKRDICASKVEYARQEGSTWKEENK